VVVAYDARLGCIILGVKIKLLVIAGLILISSSAYFGFVHLKDHMTVANQSAVTKPANNVAADKHPKRLRLIASGDFIPHAAINKEAKKADGGYDYSGMMSNMKPVFDAAEIKFCNQATGVAGPAFGITGYPCL
jgi:hypothetical protein